MNSKDKERYGRSNNGFNNFIQRGATSRNKGQKSGDEKDICEYFVKISQYLDLKVRLDALF